MTLNNIVKTVLLLIGFGIQQQASATQKEKRIPIITQVGATMLPDTIAPLENIPFSMPDLHKPSFGYNRLCITERGAHEATPITKLLNQTIEEISQKGGGTIIIPPGHWYAARIELKSGVNLHLEEGATMEFLGRAADYLPPVFTRHEGVEIMGPAAFVYACDAHHIGITGRGRIIGPPMEAEIRHYPNGNSVIEKDIPYKSPVETRICDGQEGRTFYKPKMISPIRCTDVLIEGITLERSAFWNIAPTYCNNVIIRGVTVHSTGVPSGDGIDIESCKNVLVEYCTLSCGDDCFTIKAGRCEDGLRVGLPTENVVIRYSLARDGHGGITCGSETAGGIRWVYVHDCVFDGTEKGLRFKTRRNRGGGIEDFYAERIRMNNALEAFTWDLLGEAKYMGELAKRIPPREPNRLTPQLNHIQIRHFIIESSRRFLSANCIPEQPLTDVLIENGTAHCSHLLTRGIADVSGLTLRNIQINCPDNHLSFLDCQNVWFDNVKFSNPQKSLKIEVAGEHSTAIRFSGLTANLPFYECKTGTFNVSLESHKE